MSIGTTTSQGSTWTSCQANPSSARSTNMTRARVRRRPSTCTLTLLHEFGVDAVHSCGAAGSRGIWAVRRVVQGQARGKGRQVTTSELCGPREARTVSEWTFPELVPDLDARCKEGLYPDRTPCCYCDPGHYRCDCHRAVR